MSEAHHVEVGRALSEVVSKTHRYRDVSKAGERPASRRTANTHLVPSPIPIVYLSSNSFVVVTKRCRDDSKARERLEVVVSESHRRVRVMRDGVSEVHD